MEKKKKNSINKQKKPKILPNKYAAIVFDRVKLLLDRQEKNVEWLAIEKLGFKSKTTLYTGFKKGTITINQLEKIAEALGVHPFSFFENDIIERLTEMVADYEKNIDLKSFLLGFSRDVNKGMKIEEAARKILAPPPDPNSSNLL